MIVNSNFFVYCALALQTTKIPFRFLSTMTVKPLLRGQNLSSAKENNYG
jgi:hypothetical protein